MWGAGACCRLEQKKGGGGTKGSAASRVSPPGLRRGGLQRKRSSSAEPKRGRAVKQPERTKRGSSGHAQEAEKGCGHFHASGQAALDSSRGNGCATGAKRPPHCVGGDEPCSAACCWCSPSSPQSASNERCDWLCCLSSASCCDACRCSCCCRASGAGSGSEADALRDGPDDVGASGSCGRKTETVL